jgi:hypothetical protein
MLVKINMAKCYSLVFLNDLSIFNFRDKKKPQKLISDLDAKYVTMLKTYNSLSMREFMENITDYN